MGKKSNAAEEIVLDDGDELSVTGTEVEAVVQDIESEEGRREAYAAQPAGSPGEGEMTTAEATTEETSGKKARKAKGTTTPAKPRVSLVTHKASEVIALIAAALPGGVLTLTTDGETLDALALERIDKLDKKTREKAVNLAQSIAANKRPSVYTVQAVKAARAAGGTLSLKGLTDFYLSQCSYKPGTARRQASEMFALFPAFGIASKAEGKGTPLVLNERSVVLGYIESVSMAAPPAAASEPLAAAA